MGRLPREPVGTKAPPLMPRLTEAPALAATAPSGSDSPDTPESKTRIARSSQPAWRPAGFPCAVEMLPGTGDADRAPHSRGPDPGVVHVQGDSAHLSPSRAPPVVCGCRPQRALSSPGRPDHGRPCFPRASIIDFCARRLLSGSGREVSPSASRPPRERTTHMTDTTDPEGSNAGAAPVLPAGRRRPAGFRMGPPPPPTRRKETTSPPTGGAWNAWPSGARTEPKDRP